MALNLADIATVSRLLDEALALEPADREAWLAALPAEHQRHAEALRDMLAQAAKLDTDGPLEAPPKLPPADDAVAHAGDRVGAYRLLREIGRGGMGSVWLAERADGAYRRQVALKLPRLAWGAGLAERMAREREIGMLLEHPAIARLYDAGVDERGRPFLALEYVDGQPIDAWCEAQGLSVRDRLRLFVQVVKAVAYAHGRLVVHRDLKPSNVLVTPDGQAHLLDFGIAKLLDEASTGDAGLTQEQGRVFTLQYAAPEQIAGQVVSVQADVYAMGVLLYELVTGVLPHMPRRSTAGALEEAILSGDVPLASTRVADAPRRRALRGDVEAILSKALQRDLSRRYASADALADDLDRFMRGETVKARPDKLAYRLHKGLARHWLGVGAASAVVLAVLAGSAIAVVQARRAAKAAERERDIKAFVVDVFKANSRSASAQQGQQEVIANPLMLNGARLIEQRFDQQPELQGELYELVGGLLIDMGAFQQAIEHLNRRSDLLDRMRADYNERSKAQLAVGLALLEGRRYREAEARIRSALGLAKASPEREIDALLLLARVLLVRGQEKEAETCLTQAESRLTAHGKAPSIQHSRLIAVRARLQFQRAGPDNAIPMYEEAIAMAVAAEGPRSTAAAFMRIALAKILADSMQGDSSQRVFDQAFVVLKALGGAHEIRAALEAADFAHRRFSELQYNTLAQTLAVLDQSLSTIRSSQLPAPSWFIPQIQLWMGTVLSDAGNVARALPLLEESEPGLRGVLESPADRFYLATGMGLALMRAGRHDDADRWLQMRMAASFDGGRGLDPSATFDHTLLAKNKLMQGRLDDALAVLDRAPTFGPARAKDVAANRFGYVMLRERSLILLERGRYKEALAILQGVTLDEKEHPTDKTYHRWLLGQALCGAGHPASGLSLMRPALAEFVRVAEFPHDPELAHMRATTGICARVAGDWTTALDLAGHARGAFTAQPGVSPYYKAPLFKLERALGLRLPAV